MLYFDEHSHTYKLDGKELRSVSSVVASQFRQFNAYVVSAGIVRNKAADPESPYFGMTQQDIIQMWAESGKDAREKGTNLHRDIECFLLHKTIPSEPSIEWDMFVDFLSDHQDWVPIGSEVRVHNDKIAGTIDAVFKTPDGIVLVDWKRCKSIDFSGHGQGLGHMKHVEDCNYNKYSLQLSLYRQLIHECVHKCYIVVMHPNLDKYKKIAAQDFHVEAKALLS
jgi:hypothetical protein